MGTKDLNVDTVKGVVTLHGKVATGAEKAKAEQVAHKVKKSVEDAFKANKHVNDSGIKVASVNKGVVLLSGKTKSVATQLEAIQVADAVKGVRRVASEVQIDQ